MVPASFLNFIPSVADYLLQFSSWKTSIFPEGFIVVTEERGFQMWMTRAPLHLMITAEYSRITSKYGERGVRYALMEAGHGSHEPLLIMPVGYRR
jgi:hypothetical protein